MGSFLAVRREGGREGERERGGGGGGGSETEGKRTNMVTDC